MFVISNLQELAVSIQTCDADILNSLQNKRNWFCFGGVPGKSACRGDSGGPVMVDDPGFGYKYVETIFF